MIEHREVERKYDVPHDAEAVLGDVPGVASRDATLEQELSAVYFDTADLALNQVGATLRRRTGGSDEGWHLKRPVGRDTKQELHAGLDAAGPREAFGEVLDQIVGDRELAPVATINTRRSKVVLRDADGRPLAEFCDDRVEAFADDDEAEPLRWREWEVELHEADEEFLDAAEPVVRAAGATRAAGPSKLSRVLDRGTR